MGSRAPNAWDHPVEPDPGNHGDSRIKRRTSVDVPPGASRGRTGFGPRRPDGNRRSLGLLLALLGSVGLHLWIIGGAAIFHILERARRPEPPAPVIELVDASQFPNFVPPPAREEVVEDAPLPDRLDGQIVELPEPGTPETAPDDARFRAEHDHAPEEETASRETAVSPKLLAPDFRGTGDAAGDDVAERFEGASDKEGESLGADEETKIARAGGDVQARSERGIEEMLRDDPFGIRARQPEPAIPDAPDSRTGTGDERDETHFAAGGGSEVAMAGAPNNDYLPDIRPGDRTQLIAKKYAFAGFWKRVQGQVEPFWVTNVKSSPIGQIQRRDYLTRVSVTMTPDGKVLAVEVTRSSGISGWDRAVVDAFHEAGPFLNPPPQMVDPDGKIRMGDLGFIVSLTGGQVVHRNVDPRGGKLFPGVKEGGGPFQ